MLSRNLTVNSQNPTVKPVEQRAGLQPPRPQLQRIITETNVAVTAEIVDYYQSGMFEDPKAQRAYFRGPELLTDGHKRLIKSLRDECHNLFANGRNLRGKVNALEARLSRRVDEIVDLRQTLNAQNATIGVLHSELEAANQSINDLDHVMTRSRTSRLKRMSGIMHDDSLEFVQIKDDSRSESVRRPE